MVAPVVGAAIIGAAATTATSVVGYGKGKKAQKKQEEAQDIQWEEQIRAHEVNIELAKHQAGVEIGGIQREGAAFSRGQMAAMGAAGAEVGSGTPLMNMLQTQAGIARDVLNVQKALDIEVEYREEEIEILEGLLEEEETTPPPPGYTAGVQSGGITGTSKKKKKKPSGTGAVS